MGLTCKDVMVPPDKQHTVPPDTSVAAALNIIKNTRLRFLPVVDADGKYLGVFTAPTLLKLILPKAATLSPLGSISSKSKAKRGHLGNLSFMSLDEADFDAQVERLKGEKVFDNMSDPNNIPVIAPNTPVMEGIFLIYQYKRHVILVEPETGRFVGTMSANSLLDHVLIEPH
ncbi:CBS domain protein [Aliiruegeria haliotis]|uniref:CBS domain protein n=1 Tax=Aliiruegeria haliotis TaxID=1280846 RepID=A0A2T0RUX9_9RHOB|nr:CBS domain-containing protein [Aliiruegeria haliotis]PRY24960.1 CBS domain protein [Aliiruegeria haliotis]